MIAVVASNNHQTVIRRGVNVLEQNLDQGLSNFQNNSFDTVIMIQALQVMHFPHLVLDEMLRVGRECIITFPNFGHWRCRMYLATRGRMPVSRLLPFSWYDTPNIHFCTVRDFEALCLQRHYTVLDREIFNQSRQYNLLNRLWPNLMGEMAIYRLTCNTGEQ